MLLFVILDDKVQQKVGAHYSDLATITFLKDSSVITIGWMAWVRFLAVQDFFSPQHLDWLWSPPILLFSRNWGHSAFE
jgi:hypothetical protein